MQPVSLQQDSVQFSDSASCRQWLETLPLTNVQLAQQALGAQLAALRTAAIPPGERLAILELFKEPVGFVQSEAAKRYAGKALPLEAAAADVWKSVVALWQDLERNYRVCLQAYRSGEIAIAPHAALVTMRCLRYNGQIMLEYYRAYRQPAAETWRSLHELYAFAEQQGYARIRVADTFAQQEPDSSCAESYIHALLSYLANPYSLSARQMTFVQRWLEKWSALVGLGPQPLPAGPIPALAVDLGGSDGVVFAADLEAHPGLRYLDLEQLSKTLRQTINLLKQGQVPGKLGLGEDARQPGCENLLMLLYVQWCRAGTARTEQRVDTEEHANVCFGIAPAHYQLNGAKGFCQPGELTAREQQDLAAYGHITRIHVDATAEPGTGAPGETAVESWHVLNQSASGFMSILRDPDGHGRLTHNQLLAVRRRNGKHYHLGMVQWLKIGDEGQLYCGVRLFPGIAQPIAVRPTNLNGSSNSPYERALLLPEVATPSTPATIVLPAGWFQTGRFVEIYSDRKQVARLANLLEKGSDFDRGTVTIL